MEDETIDFPTLLFKRMIFLLSSSSYLFVRFIPLNIFTFILGLKASATLGMSINNVVRILVIW